MVTSSLEKGVFHAETHEPNADVWELDGVADWSAPFALSLDSYQINPQYLKITNGVKNGMKLIVS